MGFPHLMLARTGLAAAAMLAAATTTPATAQTPVRVVIEGGFTGPSAPFPYAQDRGFFRAEGLDVSIEAPGVPAEAISRVAAGQADVTLADINAVIRFREQNPGAPLKAVFMVYNKPPYAVIGRKSRGIAHPKDLEGKRIGAPAAEMASALFPIFAKLNDIDLSKVKIDNVAAAVREPMLAAGQIDGVTGISFNAYLSMKERGVPVDDLVVLPMADYGLQLYGDAIVVNTAFAAEQPAAVKKFLHGYLRALKETIRSPARALEAVLKRNDAAKKDIELERLRMAIQDNILTEEVHTNGLGAVDHARLTRAIDLLTQTFKFKTPLDPADIFDPSFLPPAAERKIGPPSRSG